MQLISAIFFCVWASTVTSITVQTNGNTPENKMGSTMKNMDEEIITMKPLNSKSRVGFNVTNLTVNERYRRLIPYMTFYYANNGLSTSAKDIPYSNDVEVEKAEIIEAVNIERQPKKIYHPTPYQNIPRYQTNRLQQYKTHPYPVKGYKETPHYITNPSYTPHFEQSERLNHHKIIYKPHNIKLPSVPFALPNRKPYINLFHGEDGGATRYYLPEKISKPKYKLVPYEQTPPVKIIPHESINIQPPKKSIPVPVLVSKDSVYIKPRPVRPQYAYDDISIQAPIRKPSMTVSESYYEKMHPPQESIYHPQNIYEQGEEEFKPIIFTTDSPVEITSNDHSPSTSAPRPENENAHYYHYNTDDKNVQIDAPVTNEVPLADMIQPYDVSSAPGTNPNDNGSSIRALLQALNALKAMPTYNNIDHFTIPKPLTSPLEPNKEDTRPVEENTSSEDEPIELNNEYLAPLNPPSQHLDYMNNGGGGVTTQHFPPPVNSDAEGGTPGRPGIDYPIFTAIPETKFNCKTQRYKGFFADTETRCQVWHYCDLNGGQASFLCPNGTIFSQAGLTCDWWFNVRCSSTSQLYVLNESLYKYILPHKPKFPEDYSGPLVDKYLSLKFKEMEEQFRKNKHKQSAKEDDSEEEATSTEAESDTSSQDEGSKEIENNIGAIDESSVIVESPGTSGNVQRLQD